MFGGIGTGEIIILLAIALIVIGPKKLPEVARTIGRGLGELRRASYDLQRTLSLEQLDDAPPFHQVPDRATQERLRNKTAAEPAETGGTPRAPLADAAPPTADDSKETGAAAAANADDAAPSKSEDETVQPGSTEGSEPPRSPSGEKPAGTGAPEPDAKDGGGS